MKVEITRITQTISYQDKLEGDKLCKFLAVRVTYSKWGKIENAISRIDGEWQWQQVMQTHSGTLCGFCVCYEPRTVAQVGAQFPAPSPITPAWLNALRK